MAIAENEWKAATVGHAKELQKKGYLIWWRPDMKNYSKTDPDNDPAFYLEVKNE